MTGDPAKNEANKIKHGIDFIEVQNLWSDPNLIELTSSSANEPRSLVIGTIGDRHWAAIITYRADRIRIIAVRSARKSEAALYE